MKNTALLIPALSALALLASCSKEEAVAPRTEQLVTKIEEFRGLPCPDADAQLLNRKWSLVTLERRHIDIENASQTPWISFGGRGSQEMSGFGICNELQARFTVSCEVLHFLDLTATRRYCAHGQPIEEQLLTNLRATDRFQVDREVLTLYHGHMEMATFRSDRSQLAPAATY